MLVEIENCFAIVLRDPKSRELRAAMNTARLWRDQGKPLQAPELLAPVYDWFTEAFRPANANRI